MLFKFKIFSSNNKRLNEAVSFSGHRKFTEMSSGKMTNAQFGNLLLMTNASTIEETWAVLVASMADFGFDRLFYGFTSSRTSKGLGDPGDFLLLSNHEPSYIATFIGDGHYQNAPMVNWALENEGACSWSIIKDLKAKDNLTNEEERVIDLNVSQQISAGYSISFKSVSRRAKGAIGLTAEVGLSQPEVDAIWAVHGETIILLNNVAHLKILTLPFNPDNQTLTSRQREALEWVGDGKTSQDIATLMGLSQATVEKHLRLARKALNVETTAQAVMKALFQNQMFLIDD